MPTTLKAVLRVPPGSDQTSAGNVQVDGERLVAWMEFQIPVRSPLREDRTMCDFDALEYPAETHPGRIEHPCAVARLQNDGIHGTSVSDGAGCEL